MADGRWQYWNVGEGEGWQMDCGYLAQVTIDHGPAGWQVRVHEGPADAVAARNLQRLSRWRHTRLADADTAQVLRQVFARPRPLTTGVRASGLPELPTVARALHLVWTRELLIDWTRPFVPARSLVWSPEGAC